MLDQFAHVSWITIVGVAVIGLGLVCWANRRQSRPLLLAGVAGLALAAVLLAGRTLIVTDRARCEKRTAGLVDAANRNDWTAFATLLDEHTVVSTIGTLSIAGRKNIVTEVQARCGELGLKGISVRSLESKQDQTLITVDLVVASLQDATQDRPLTTTWQFDYEQTGKDWTLDTVTLIRVGNEPAQSISNYH